MSQTAAHRLFLVFSLLLASGMTRPPPKQLGAKSATGRRAYLEARGGMGFPLLSFPLLGNFEGARGDGRLWEEDERSGKSQTGQSSENARQSSVVFRGASPAARFEAAGRHGDMPPRPQIVLETSFMPMLS